jgi:hypothetical protein
LTHITSNSTSPEIDYPHRRSSGVPLQGALPERTVTVEIPDGVHAVTVYNGFVGPGSDTWLQLDDFSVSR